MLQCSRSCGRGQRMREVVCRDVERGWAAMDPDYCDASTRPPTSHRCRMARCPRWRRSKWSLVMSAAATVTTTVHGFEALPCRTCLASRSLTHSRLLLFLRPPAQKCQRLSCKPVAGGDGPSWRSRGGTFTKRGILGHAPWGICQRQACSVAFPVALGFGSSTTHSLLELGSLGSKFFVSTLRLELPHISGRGHERLGVSTVVLSELRGRRPVASGAVLHGSSAPRASLQVRGSAQAPGDAALPHDRLSLVQLGRHRLVQGTLFCHPPEVKSPFTELQGLPWGTGLR